MIRFRAHKELTAAAGKMALNLSFQLESGQLISLFGPSGAGKTTILRILAGLTRADSSYIEVENEVWDHSEKKIHVPVQKRSIGFVFQDYMLFPNLSVKENLAFALQKGEDGKIVNELLEMMELGGLQNEKPANLSGGQQQRVALARAIARKPKILLLDEPLSALDDEIRLKLQDYIFEAHQYYKLTTILVSHHLPEILRLSDKVIVIDKGRILRQGKPRDVFAELKSSSPFELTGEVIDISRNDIVYTVSVLYLNNIIKIIATETEIRNVKVGDKVSVLSKVFHPLIRVIS